MHTCTFLAHGQFSCVKTQNAVEGFVAATEAETKCRAEKVVCEAKRQAVIASVADEGKTLRAPASCTSATATYDVKEVIIEIIISDARNRVTNVRIGGDKPPFKGHRYWLIPDNFAALKPNRPGWITLIDTIATSGDFKYFTSKSVPPPDACAGWVGWQKVCRTSPHGTGPMPIRLIDQNFQIKSFFNGDTIDRSRYMLIFHGVSDSSHHACMRDAVLNAMRKSGTRDGDKFDHKTLQSLGVPSDVIFREIQKMERLPLAPYSILKDSTPQPVNVNVTSGTYGEQCGVPMIKPLEPNDKRKPRIPFEEVKPCPNQVLKYCKHIIYFSHILHEPGYQEAVKIYHGNMRQWKWRGYQDNLLAWKDHKPLRGFWHGSESADNALTFRIIPGPKRQDPSNDKVRYGDQFHIVTRDGKLKLVSSQVPRNAHAGIFRGPDDTKGFRNKNVGNCTGSNVSTCTHDFQYTDIEEYKLVNAYLFLYEVDHVPNKPHESDVFYLHYETPTPLVKSSGDNNNCIKGNLPADGSYVQLETSLASAVLQKNHSMAIQGWTGKDRCNKIPAHVRTSIPLYDEYGRAVLPGTKIVSQANQLKGATDAPTNLARKQNIHDLGIAGAFASIEVIAEENVESCRL